MLRNLIIGAATILMITGCASQETRRQAWEYEAQQAMNEGTRECNAIFSDTRLDLLRQKFPPDFSRHNIRLRHLADENYVSGAEREELLIYDELARQCDAKLIDLVAKYDPPGLSAYQDHINRLNNLLPKLYNSEITYGQYFKLWQQSAEQLR
jgi:hypothetical protein